MNLVLFTEEECRRPLPPSDPRTRHILEILQRRVGDGFDCGLLNGPRGRAGIRANDSLGLHLDFTWDPVEPPPLAPLTLLVGLPRPQTVRKIVTEATTLGVRSLVFFRADKGEKSYGDSSLWSSGELTRLLVAAAEQAFCTRVPTVARAGALSAALELTASSDQRFAFDNYEARLGPADVPASVKEPAAMVAVGPERGWSAAERDLLRAADFRFVHLGPRVLRTETACTAALAVIKTRLGLW